MKRTGSPISTTYYAMIEGKQCGPFTMSELEFLSREGFLSAYTPVRNVDYGFDYWPLWRDIRPWLMPFPPGSKARPFSDWNGKFPSDLS